jgi:hypothetical protein
LDEFKRLSEADFSRIPVFRPLCGRGSDSELVVDPNEYLSTPNLTPDEFLSA